MKALLLIIFFFALKSSCFCQKDSSGFMFEDAVRSLKELNTIIYIDSAMNYYTRISKVSKKGNVNGYRDTAKVILHLLKSEISFLDREFKTITHFVWKENMFNNSIRTSIDSANRLRLKIMTTTDNKKDKRYFHFSRVIYLRNNSLALFRLAGMYGFSAGYDYLFFYLKEDSQWKRYMRVDMGAW